MDFAGLSSVQKFVCGHDQITKGNIQNQCGAHISEGAFKTCYMLINYRIKFDEPLFELLISSVRIQKPFLHDHITKDLI